MPDVSRSANTLGTMSLPDMIYLEDQMQWHISIMFNSNSLYGEQPYINRHSLTEEGVHYDVQKFDIT